MNARYVHWRITGDCYKRGNALNYRTSLNEFGKSEKKKR